MTKESKQIKLLPDKPKTETFSFNGNQVLCDGRRIGWTTRSMEKKRVFVSPRDRNKHFFRKYKGWGINRELWLWLEAQGFDEVHLKLGERVMLVSKLADWRKNGIAIHYKPHEPQIVLPEVYMKKDVLMMSQVSERIR